MVFIWKGIGLIVPIGLVGIGLLVSLFFDDKRLGNTSLLGWSFFCASLLFIIIGGLLTLSTKDEEGNPLPKVSVKRHTFFFIPVLFWGIILFAVSIYLLFIYNPNKTTSFEPLVDFESTELTENENTVVNFYNPTNDTLVYIFVDQYGTSEEVKLGNYESDYQLASGQEDQANLIGAMTLDGLTTQMLQPTDKNNYDKAKFISVDENGKKVLLRKVRYPTPATNDYDEVWVLLSKDYNLALVDVSSLYPDGKFNSDLIKSTNWSDKVTQKHSGSDLIEISVSHPEKEGKIQVIEPNTSFPKEVSNKTKTFFLIDYQDEKELTNTHLKEEIIRLTTD